MACTAGDPIITTQTFNSGTAGIGLLQEHAAPTNFCGGKCIGGTVLVNKLEDPNAPTGFYQVNILYYKSLINGTGIKAIVYFDCLRDDQGDRNISVASTKSGLAAFRRLATNPIFDVTLR